MLGKVIGSEGEVRGVAEPQLQSQVAWCGILTCYCELLKRGRFSHIAETKGDLGRFKVPGAQQQASWGQALSQTSISSSSRRFFSFYASCVENLKLEGWMEKRCQNSTGILCVSSLFCGEEWKTLHVCYLRQPVLLQHNAMNWVSPRLIFLWLDHCSWIVFPLYPCMRYRFVACVCVCAPSLPSMGLRQECESVVLSLSCDPAPLSSWWEYHLKQRKGGCRMKSGLSAELWASQQTSTLSVGHCGFLTEKITSSSVRVRTCVRVCL